MWLKLAELAYRIFRERKERKGKAVFKGKLTYATGVFLAVQALAAVLGVDVAPAEVDVIVAFVTLAANLYGRWRATRALKNDQLPQ